MMRRVFTFSVLLFLVILPLQTHYSISQPRILGAPLDFGRPDIFLTDIVFLAACIGFIASRSSKRLPPPLPTLIIFVCILGISTAIAGHSSASWYLTLRFIEGVILAWMIAESGIPFRRLAYALCSGMLVVAAFGIWQFLSQSVPASSVFGLARHTPDISGTSIVITEAARFLRAYGTFPHPNMFGGFLVVSILLSMWIMVDWFMQKRPARIAVSVARTLWVYAAILLLSALVVTFSRSSALALVCGSIMMISLSFASGWKRHVLAWIQVGIGVFIMLAFWSSVLLPIITSRVAVTESHEVTSIQERGNAYVDAWNLLRDSWWKGVGLGMFVPSIADIDTQARQSWQLTPVHNIFVLIATEASVFGGLALIISFFAIGSQLVKKMLLKNDRFPASGVAFAILIALAIIGMFDHYLVSLPAGILLLFTVFGLSMRAIKEP